MAALVAVSRHSLLTPSCVPKNIFIERVVGGDETLRLMAKLGILLVTSNVVNDNISDREELDEWVVPLVHLFPLEIPQIELFPIPSSSSAGHGMTATVDDINSDC